MEIQVIKSKGTNMAYPCNGILFSNKKEWTTDTCYQMDEPQKDAKWKKPDKRDHILYVSIYRKCLGIDRSIETDSRLMVDWVGMRMGINSKWSWVILLQRWRFLKLIYGVFHNLVNLLKIIELYTWNGWII